MNGYELLCGQLPNCDWLHHILVVGTFLFYLNMAAVSASTFESFEYKVLLKMNKIKSHKFWSSSKEDLVKWPLCTRMFCFPLGLPCAKCVLTDEMSWLQNWANLSKHRIKFLGKGTGWQLVSWVIPPMSAGGSSCFCYCPLFLWYERPLVGVEMWRVWLSQSLNDRDGVGGWQPLTTNESTQTL